MDADPELDAPILLNAGIALDHAALHLNGAAHGIDNAAEFDQRSVSGALDDAAVVHGDGWIDQVAAQCPQPCQLEAGLEKVKEVASHVVEAAEKTAEEKGLLPTGESPTVG